MKTTLIALGTAALMFAAAPAAFAESYSPANTTITFEGDLALEQSTPLVCATTLEVTTNAAGTDADVTGGDFALGDFQCLFVSPDTSPAWDVGVSSSSGGVATGLLISDMKAVSLVGTCGPDDITVGWNNTTDTITVSGSISGSPNSCSIAGTLVADQNVSIAP